MNTRQQISWKVGMVPRSLFGLARSVSSLLNQLEDNGIFVEIGDDFAQYRALRVAQTERGGIYPMFDAAASYIDHRNGFWITGRDEDGTLMHTQAVCLLDLHGITLAEHLWTHRHKYITPNTTPDPDQTYYAGPRALEAITGRVCYQGDFWLQGRGLGGPRSLGATALLSRLLFEIMHASWRPDYVFALVPKALGAKGAGLRYGYSHCEPGAWIGPDRQITEEDFFIWMSAEDIDHKAREDVARRAPSASPRPGLNGAGSPGLGTAHAPGTLHPAASPIVAG
ncbi:MAG: hypothetical protein AAGF68_03820, partial [Pseudomonadota bacterium]